MKNKRTCASGHSFFKTSDCPVCPICERDRKSTTDFFNELSAPARRALQNKGVTTLQQLAAFSKKEILALHGMGPASMPRLSNALKKAGLIFKN